MGEPLWSFPVARIRPKPGVDPEDVELPGAGLYEADYSVPGWVAQILNGLGADELDFDQDFTVPFANGMDLEHLRTQWRGTKITIRARLVEKERRPAGPTVQTGLVSAGQFVRTVFRHPRFALVVEFGIVAAVVKGLIEVRKFAELSGGTVLVVGGGLALAGLGVAKIRGG